MIRYLLATLAVVGVLAAMPAFAGTNDPLFVNMTSDDAHRATMALAFSKAQQERGHPLTIWLNDRGVLVGSKEHTAKYGEPQKMLSDLMAQGVVVIACPMCMKHYGMEEGDLIEGVKVGNPDLTGGALFKNDTQTLTW